STEGGAAAERDLAPLAEDPRLGPACGGQPAEQVRRSGQAAGGERRRALRRQQQVKARVERQDNEADRWQALAGGRPFPKTVEQQRGPGPGRRGQAAADRRQGDRKATAGGKALARGARVAVLAKAQHLPPGLVALPPAQQRDP